MIKTHPGCLEYLKKKIKFIENCRIYAEYLNENNESIDYITLQNVIPEVSELVCRSKDDYHKQLARKLTKPKTSSKTYYSILKIFYNRRKVSLILLLILKENQITSTTFLLQNVQS